MSGTERTLHGVAFCVGEAGLLVTGPSGSGKTSLVLTLQALWTPDPVRLVADDRVRLQRRCGRLVLRPTPGFEGLAEVRGLGIRRIDHLPSAVAAAIVTLDADPPRLPEDADGDHVDLLGVRLPRLRLRQGPDAALAFAARWPAFQDSFMASRSQFAPKP